MTILTFYTVCYPILSKPFYTINNHKTVTKALNIKISTGISAGWNTASSTTDMGSRVTVKNSPSFPALIVSTEMQDFLMAASAELLAVERWLRSCIVFSTCADKTG